MTLAQQSLASSPAHSSLRGLEMRLNKVQWDYQCVGHICSLLHCVFSRRQVQQSIKDHFPVRRSSRRCKTVLEVRHYLQ